ncbi:MAG: S41 family peptidase [Bacteroidia bacterium]|jgi:carboxyl-terminal processing protease|nr:S41 family peptidase [Bacteroidia bacterium]
MNNKIWQPVIYSILIAFGIVIGIYLSPSSSGFYSGTNDKISELLQIINQAYVDSVNADSIEERTIETILTNLDPHSVYIAANNVKQANEGLEGNFEGVGIEFSIIDDTIMVANVIKDGPAFKAGLIAGDRIIMVDTTRISIKGITTEKVFKLLRGEAGSTVELTCYRPTKKSIIRKKIKRGVIPIYSVDASIMLDNRTGYIKIERFAATTHEEFIQAITDLKSKGMEQLVLDLRNNPGGYLSSATGLADEFIAGKKLLVYTSGRMNNRAQYESGKVGAFEQGKLIILIDEGSASASEIVSGAIQDWDRGIIVGRRSFGKGLVQESFQLRDQSAVRLTVSRYYIPSGRCIQKDYKAGNEAYEMEINHRFEIGEVQDEKKFIQADTTVYFTGNGRKVYGGGGITPDVFVPADTAYLNPFYYALFDESLLNRFVFYYVDEQREKLVSTYLDANSFNLHFSINQQLWNSFLSYVKQHSKKSFSTKEITLAEKKSKQMLKAMIARQIWREEGYYRVLSSEDNAIQKAIITMGTNYNSLLKGGK